MKLIETELFKPANFAVIAFIAIIASIGYTAFKNRTITAVSSEAE